MQNATLLSSTACNRCCSSTEPAAILQFNACILLCNATGSRSIGISMYFMVLKSGAGRAGVAATTLTAVPWGGDGAAARHHHSYNYGFLVIMFRASQDRGSDDPKQGI